MPDDNLVMMQGDTGPNPVFHLRNSSPTAGSTPRTLASVASAYIRWGLAPSAPTVYLLPATVMASTAAADGFLEAYIASVAANASLGPLAVSGRYGAQVVLRGPWGVETWPRDASFPVVVSPRLGAL